MIQKTYLKTKDTCKVKFTLSAENANSVAVVGLNNDWENPIPLTKKKDGSFAAEVALTKGSQHEFKYLVNGTEWLNDETADSQSINEFGSTNSVIVL
ncbi:MAG: isoamylase early set domain-containing protein [Chitinophagaceae bacterium]